jgi:capsular polysaccharide biosynthesis protein
VGPYTSAFQKESLVALGIDPRNIHSAADAVSFSCERMWVPSNLGRIYHPAFKMSGWATDFLRSSFMRPSIPSAGARVYLSRGDAARRRICNEPDLVIALEARGFRAVHLSALPFLEQAQLLRDAQVTIGLHGAGLSHVLFQQPGGALVEIFPSSYGTMSFYVMAVAMGNRYFTYNEEAVVPGAWTQCDDIVVDVDAFMQGLDRHVLIDNSP